MRFTHAWFLVCATAILVSMAIQVLALPPKGDQAEDMSISSTGSIFTLQQMGCIQNQYPIYGIPSSSYKIAIQVCLPIMLVSSPLYITADLFNSVAPACLVLTLLLVLVSSIHKLGIRLNFLMCAVFPSIFPTDLSKYRI